VINTLTATHPAHPLPLNAGSLCPSFLHGLRSHARRCGQLALLVATLKLAACGGGGDTITLPDAGAGTPVAPVVVAPPVVSPAPAPLTPSLLSLDDWVAVKLAALLIEVSTTASNFGPYAIDRTWADSWNAAPGTTATGCTVETRSKSGTLPTTLDRIARQDSGCQLAHAPTGFGAGQLQWNSLLVNTLLQLTDTSMPLLADWRYEDRYEYTGTVSFSFFMLNGSAIDGLYETSSQWGNLSVHRADGSQSDTTTYVTRGRETSSLGPSEFVREAVITCVFAAGAVDQPGTCTSGQTRLSGVIYGQPVQATWSHQGTPSDRFWIDNQGQRTEVVLEQASDNLLDRRFRIRTPSGMDVVLTGEDANWLGLF
jgi:hypothetical protein